MTVVVAVSDEETIQIEPGLNSVLDQRHRNVRVQVVGHGRCERVLAIARECAGRDPRVRVSRGICEDLHAAWNAGAAGAKGEYLSFMHGGDEVPPRGIRRMVASLQKSGSSFAAGTVTWPPRIGAAMFPPTVSPRTHDAVQTTLEESPEGITDLLVENRLFRRSFWRESALRFESGHERESGLVLSAFLKASSFDLLKQVTYNVRDRHDGEALGSMPNRLVGLDDTIAHFMLCRDRVRSMGVLAAEHAWLEMMLDWTIQPLLEDVERATPQQWEDLQGAAERLMSAGDFDQRGLRAESRVKLWLLLHDRREALESFVAQRWREHGHVATEVRDGKVLALLPHFSDPDICVPVECYEMSEAETPLVVVLRGASWTAEGRISLALFARVRHVSMDTAPQVEGRLVDTSTGRQLPVEVRVTRDLEANQFNGGRYQDYSWGALTVLIGPMLLAEAAGTQDTREATTWSLGLRLTTQEVTRSGGLTALDHRGSVAAIGMGHVAARSSGDFMVGPVRDPDRILLLQRFPRTGPELLTARFEGRTVTGTLDTTSSAPVAVRVFSGSTEVTVPLQPSGSEATFTVEVPEGRLAHSRPHWQMRAVDLDGSEQQILWPQAADQRLSSGQGALAGHRTRDGHVDLVEAADTLIADRIDLVDGDIQLTAHWLGASPATAQVRLLGPDVVIDGESQPDSAVDGDLHVRFTMECDEWGLGALPAPVGRYWFDLDCGPDRAHKGRVLLSGDLLDQMLHPQVDDTYSLRHAQRGREAGVLLAPPLTEDERGLHARQLNQEWCLSGEIPIEPDTVYFQTYSGASATDSQLAIHEELRRRRPETTAYWGIADRSSAVPTGAIGVIMGSREYFRVLGSAAHLVMNVDPERWFSPRPGQQFLQTFHGYPAKTMGLGLWRAKAYTPRRIEGELQRTAADWDLILTPAPEMDVHYREQYSYEGRIHSAGYPRDDVLVSPEVTRIREETRARLGIGPDQTVVLYAPTWRDDLATTWRSAQMVQHLDLETASRQLGSDYTLLMRGHRFHARSGERSANTSRLLDVTAYPEINDLILAADVAVLDYSSLRFDFALTGRPMIFLVPDLAAYTGGVRGFLYDFTGSAPGPLLQSADEVVDKLRDLEGLQVEWAEELARFNQKFNYLQDGKAAERVVDAFFGE